MPDGSTEDSDEQEEAPRPVSKKKHQRRLVVPRTLQRLIELIDDEDADELTVAERKIAHTALHGRSLRQLRLAAINDLIYLGKSDAEIKLIFLTDPEYNPLIRGGNQQASAMFQQEIKKVRNDREKKGPVVTAQEDHDRIVRNLLSITLGALPNADSNNLRALLERAENLAKHLAVIEGGIEQRPGSRPHLTRPEERGPKPPAPKNPDISNSRLADMPLDLAKIGGEFEPDDVQTEPAEDQE